MGQQMTERTDKIEAKGAGSAEVNPDQFVQAQAHGGDVWGASRLLGLPARDILDLSASLNPLGPPAGLIDEIVRAMENICHYPDRQTLELRRALAKKFGVRAGNVLPGNGSTNLIRLLSRALTKRNIVLLAPSFGEFSRALALAGAHFHFYPLSERNNFQPAMQDVEKIFADSPSCVILSNPLTPSGGLVDPQVLNSIVTQAQRKRAWVILDEAFIDFAPQEDRDWPLKLLEDNPRLVVLRSMTKFYCLAGLRLGYILSARQTVSQLAPLGEPWSVNTLSQQAGVYCLGQEEYEAKTREVVNKWREQQIARLKDIGYYVYPSAVNYILTRLPADGPNAAQVASFCLSKGVLVRDCSNFSGCTGHHLRIAVATPEEQDRLFEVLEQAPKA
jgi:threonine-phosphate decarboxylase